MALLGRSTATALGYDPSGNRTSQTNVTSTASSTPIWGMATWPCF